MRALVVMTSCGALPVPSGPTVVELFTAQGCPSCPAADRSLAGLVGRPDLIALSLPVTYWDTQGWRDPLAQDAFTHRQRRYASVGRRDAATPQFVIDGRFATNDADASALARAIRAASRSGGPTISARGNRLTVGADERTARRSTIWLFDFDPRPVTTSIWAGQRRWTTAVQYNVVRRLTAVGTWTGRPMRLTLPMLPIKWRRAAIVQSDDGSAIVAAAVLP